MSEDVNIIEESAESKSHMIIEAVRKVFLAGIGAAKIAQEEVSGMVGDTEGYLNKIVEETEAFINKLVEKGAIAENDGKQLMSDMMEKRRTVVKDSAEKAQSGLDKRVEDVLTRLNIPTKTDIDELSKKIGQLGRKVDNLKRIQEQTLAAEQAEPVVKASKEAVAKSTKKATDMVKETANGAQEVVEDMAA